MKIRIILMGLLLFGSVSFVFATPAEDSYNQGKKYYDQYLYDQAIASFQDAASQDPNYWEAYQMLAYSYYKLEKIGSAATAAEKSLKINGNNNELRKFVSDHLHNSKLAPAPDEHTISGASEASAAETKVENSIYINLGGSLPLSPASFTSGQSFGYNGGLGLGIGVSRTFQILLDANADNFPLNTSGSSVSGGALRVFTFLANARLKFTPENNRVVPYGIAGVGASLVAQDSSVAGSTTFPGSSNTYFVIRLGLGLEFKMSDYASLFVEPNGLLVFSANNSGAGNLLFNSFRLGGKFNL
jgi:opacity protein-like surface antigen